MFLNMQLCDFLVILLDTPLLLNTRIYLYILIDLMM